MNTTNEDLKLAMTRGQRFEWAFRIVLSLLISILCFMGRDLLSDVKRLPQTIASQFADVSSRITRAEMKEQSDSDGALRLSDWTNYHANFEQRLSKNEGEIEVLKAKLDALGDNQKRTTEAVETLNHTITGFQIDFQTYKRK